MYLNKQKEENMYFTKNEIDALAQYAENSQDGVILSLIFDGISHKNNFIELRNIRIQDVDQDKMVINIPELHDEETGETFHPRQVAISTETLKMIEGAMNFDEKYLSFKGKTSSEYKIAESDYIVRDFRDNVKIKRENLNQSILHIAEIAGYEFLNETTISYSGQLHYAIEMINNGIKVENVITTILKRFNIPDNTSSRYYLKDRIEKYLEKEN